MRILHIIPSMDPTYGGPCKCLRDMIPAWSSFGDIHEVVSLDDPSSSFLGVDPFTIHAIGQRKGPLGFNNGLYPWLLKFLPGYDTVIIHGLWQWHSMATRKACLRLKKKKPYCVMPHGNLDTWFQRDPRNMLKYLRNTIYWKMFEHKIIRDAEVVLFTCKEELHLAREPYRPYHPKKEKVVGLGVSAPPPIDKQMKIAFQNHTPYLSEKSPYFLYVGRIHPKKGVRVLIDAYTNLAKEFSHNIIYNYKDEEIILPSLVIAGPIDSDYAKELIQYAKNKLPGFVYTLGENITKSFCAKNKQSIHFTGMLQGDAKWGAFYGCEAFILPSHQESFGIAVVEALACSKVVLITNKVNIWREIDSTSGGLTGEDTQEGIEKIIKNYLQENKGKYDPRNCYLKHFKESEPAQKFHVVMKEEWE